MDIEKYIKGVMSASPEKRYNTFLTTVADREGVWVLSNENGLAMFGDETDSYLLVWPRQEFASIFASEDEETIEIEVHDFIDMCRQQINEDKVMVFPTHTDAYVISGSSLADDLEMYLDEVE